MCLWTVAGNVEKSSNCSDWLFLFLKKKLHFHHNTFLSLPLTQASQLGVYKAFVDNYKVALETAEKCSHANTQFQKISEVRLGAAASFITSATNCISFGMIFFLHSQICSRFYFKQNLLLKQYQLWPHGESLKHKVQTAETLMRLRNKRGQLLFSGSFSRCK